MSLIVRQQQLSNQIVSLGSNGLEYPQTSETQQLTWPDKLNQQLVNREQTVIVFNGLDCGLNCHCWVTDADIIGVADAFKLNYKPLENTLENIPQQVKDLWNGAFMLYADQYRQQLFTNDMQSPDVKAIIFKGIHQIPCYEAYFKFNRLSRKHSREIFKISTVTCNERDINNKIIQQSVMLNNIADRKVVREKDGVRQYNKTKIQEIFNSGRWIQAEDIQQDPDLKQLQTWGIYGDMFYLQKCGEYMSVFGFKNTTYVPEDKLRDKYMNILDRINRSDRNNWITTKINEDSASGIYYLRKLKEFNEDRLEDTFIDGQIQVKPISKSYKLELLQRKAEQAETFVQQTEVKRLQATEQQDSTQRKIQFIPDRQIWSSSDEIATRSNIVGDINRHYIQTVKNKYGCNVGQEAGTVIVYSSYRFDDKSYILPYKPEDIARALNTKLYTASEQFQRQFDFTAQLKYTWDKVSSIVINGETLYLMYVLAGFIAVNSTIYQTNNRLTYLYNNMTAVRSTDDGLRGIILNGIKMLLKLSGQRTGDRALINKISSSIKVEQSLIQYGKRDILAAYNGNQLSIGLISPEQICLDDLAGIITTDIQYVNNE